MPALIAAGGCSVLGVIDNQYTIEGTSLERVHTVGEGHREETWQLRAVWLKSERYHDRQIRSD